MHGADPYRTASLAACEHASVPWRLYSAPHGLVVPAPLPPYALLAFVPFALLTYSAAAMCWFIVLAACVVVSVRLLSQTLAVQMPFAAWLLLLPATVLWLPFGETAPIALLGAALAARALQRGQWAVCALGLALFALEPHVALGAWICVAAFVPRMRVPLAVAAAALLGASFAIGAALPAEYALRVLPVHALAELPRPAQYSAAWLLNAAGVSPELALRAGSASYALMLAAGIFTASRLRNRWNDCAVLVYAPMAFALTGGAFIHASQLALALPFAVSLALRERGAVAAVAALACAALTVPWMQGGQQQVIVLAGIAVASIVVWNITRNERLSAGAMTVWIVLVALLLAVHRFPAASSHAARVFPVAAGQGQLASAVWGRSIWREQSTATIADWLGKAPSWIALLLLVGGAARAAAHKEPVLAVRIDEAPALP
jgi:hypothetical protein